MLRRLAARPGATLTRTGYAVYRAYAQVAAGPFAFPNGPDGKRDFDDLSARMRMGIPASA
jgi:hypothetical protein